MSTKTCFVIMPIGNQEYGEFKISANELKKKYDDLIKEAILKADSELDVVRADEVAIPGTITSDILTRIMHSDFVVADVTYPNPNVFYELGLRHACRTGTIIIRDNNGPKIPFDIAHLRHIGYENTPSGLKELSEKLILYFYHMGKNPNHPDNQLLELASFTGYKFLDFGKHEDKEVSEVDTLMNLIQSPGMIQILQRHVEGEEIDQSEVINAVLSNPASTESILKYMINSGELSLKSSQTKKVGSTENAINRRISSKKRKKSNNKKKRK